MKQSAKKPKLYIHVGQATHFLRWEIPEFAKHFDLIEAPENNVPMLVFGPDVLESALELPASKRYAVLFPGFGHNPLYNKQIKAQHKKLIKKYDLVFINPGPLELAYRELDNIVKYPFSVDTSIVRFKKPRKKIRKIIHISSDYPQKDWRRSEEIMKKTGLKWEVYPSRETKDGSMKKIYQKTRQFLYEKTNVPAFKLPPHGYVDHKKVVKKYNQNDVFIHAAKDIKDPIYIDGKYTATLMEAGMSGCIIFWHDTFGLGNTLDTVFQLPLDTDEAARLIKNTIKSIDIKEHSLKTHDEMVQNFNPVNSVKIRAEAILNDLKVR